MSSLFFSNNGRTEYLADAMGPVMFDQCACICQPRTTRLFSRGPDLFSLGLSKIMTTIMTTANAAIAVQGE